MHFCQGINRNIVECKFAVFDLLEEAFRVLIETLWNVNEIKLLICIQFKKRINRNIVECKYSLLHIS